MSLLDTLARFLLAFLFLYAAVSGIWEFSTRKSMMEAKNIPYTQYLLPLIIALKFLGGLSILLNIYPRLGAFLLILCMATMTYYFADFWKKTGAEQKNSFNLFTANLAIIGGLLLLITR